MKRVGHLYEKMCDKNLIHTAIKKASKGKRNKRAVRQVLAHENAYVDKIYDMLVNEQIKLSPNKYMTIYDHSCSKEREITIPKFYPDQIIHWVLMLVIQPIIEKGMYRWNCGSIPNRGGLEAKKFVEKSLKDKELKYVVKLDISKFFNNVKPNILLEMFKHKIKDSRVIDLIDKILKNGGDCLPIGYYTSQWFSNFYLEKLDHFIKEDLHIKYYVRYVDDMVLMDTNKRKLRNAIVEIEKFLNNIRLKLKDNKQLWKIGSRPIDFVGYRFYKDRTLLRKKIFYKLNRRIRNIKKTNNISKKQAQGLMSLIGWLKHIYAINYYRDFIYNVAPKWKLSKIIGDKYYGKNIQQTRMAY